MKRKKHDYRQDAGKFRNYMAIVAIFPTVFSVMAYEFVAYFSNIVFKHNPDYNPLEGLGMLIPMALLTEFFMFLFSSYTYRNRNVSLPYPVKP